VIFILKLIFLFHKENEKKIIILKNFIYITF